MTKTESFSVFAFILIVGMGVNRRGLADGYQTEDDSEYNNIYRSGMLRSVRSMPVSSLQFYQEHGKGGSNRFDILDTDLPRAVSSGPTTAEDMIRTMRSGLPYGIRTGGILRSVRSAAPFDLYRKGILRSV